MMTRGGIVCAGALAGVVSLLATGVEAETVRLPEAHGGFRLVPDGHPRLSISRRTSLEVMHGSATLGTGESLLFEADPAATDADLEAVSSVPAVRHVYCARCPRLTDAGVAHLRRLPRLRYLYLLYCNGITDRAVHHTGAMSGLRVLSFYHCPNVSDTGLAGLGPLKKLEDLSLTGCRRVTDRGLGEISGLTGLQSLSLAGCTRITDRGLADLGALTGLTSLNLSGCEGVTDAGLSHVGRLRSLRTLVLANLPRVTGEGLGMLAGLDGLQALYLTRSVQIDDAALLRLAPLRSLRHVYVEDCTRVTPVGADRFRTHLPDCRLVGAKGDSPSATPPGAPPAPEPHPAARGGSRHAGDPRYARIFGQLDAVAAHALAVVDEKLGLAPERADDIAWEVKDLEPGAERSFHATTGTRTTGGRTRYVITLYTEYYLSGEERLEVVMPHEMTHAAMRSRMGSTAYRRVPRWAREGLALWAAGEGELHIDRKLADVRDPRELMTGLMRERGQIAAYPYAYLATEYLEREGGPGSVRRWARLVTANEPAEEAVATLLQRPFARFESGLRGYAWARLQKRASALDAYHRARGLTGVAREEALERFLREHPASPYAANACYYLARSRFDRGAYARAGQGFREVVDRYAGLTGLRDEAALYRGLCALKQGDFATATERLSDFVKLYPWSGQHARGLDALATCRERLR